MYENGVLMRLKYLHLFPSDGFFRTSNMKIVSSASDRCIMSLQSFMSGFFPPPILDLTIPLYWQPFTHSIDYDGKIVYYVTKDCPRLNAEAVVHSQLMTDQYGSWLEADRAILDQLEVQLRTTLKTQSDVYRLGDNLKAMMPLDCHIPQSVLDTYSNTVHKYMVDTWGKMALNPTLTKLKGGPMVTEIVNNMVAVANNETSAKNFIIFSAHDTTVGSLACALGVSDQLPSEISYADSIMVDLIQTSSGEYTVEVIYLSKANTFPERITMTVPGCGVPCTLTNFRASTSGMMVDDWDQLCSL